MHNIFVFIVIITKVVSNYLTQQYTVDDLTHIFRLKSTNSDHIKLFEKVKNVFREESNVIFEYEGNDPETFTSQLYHLDMIFKDRTCLLASPSVPKERVRVNFTENFNIETMINFINIKLNTFRSIDGNLTEFGHRIRKYTLEPYKIESSDKCERVPLNSLTSEIFLHKYLLPQRPVVITGLKLSHQNIIDDLLAPYLSEEVGVKLSDSMDFEGIDYLTNWEDPNNKQFVPPEVLSQLESPDRVVVRAAHKDMTLKSFLNLLVSKNNNNFNISSFKKSLSKYNMKQIPQIHAYVEYLDLNSHLLGLGSQLSDYIQLLNKSLSLPFLEGVPYLWLGDGNTIGKLHFDPYDNLLIQLEGSKSFELVDVSDNERLYEGHIREAQIDIISSSGNNNKIEKVNILTNTINPADTTQTSHPTEKVSKRLLESTSMVHSPIRLHFPQDLIRYPKASNITTLTCVVNAGEVIYVPSFFWHEVTSSPPKQIHNIEIIQELNMALNYWFTPLFEKEFPCANCKKKFNVKYREKLATLF